MNAAEAAAPAADAVQSQLYRLIAETLPHMVWTARPDGELDFLNLHAFEYTGRPAAELEGWAWKPVVHPEEWDACLARWTASLASGEPYEIEHRLRRHDGAYRWHLAAARPLRDAEGRIVKWFGTCTDIDGRKRADEREARSREELEALVAQRTKQLRESESRFQSFMENVPVGAWIKDSHLRLGWINRHDIRNAGRAMHEVIGRDDFDLQLPEVARQLRIQDEAVLRARRPLQFVSLIPHADGSAHSYLVVKFPLADAEGATGVAGVAIDITERLRLEDTVRQLLNRLVRTQEAERRKVAADLHDLIGQKLTALGINLDIVRQALPAAATEPLEPRLRQMAALLGETIGSIREVMSELRPPMLDDHGLVPALHWYASIFETRTGLPVRVSGAELRPRLDRELEIALFRIAQEALTNAAKHSGASQVQLRVEQTAQAVRMRVEDDGGGFGDAKVERVSGRGGWGLQAMRERAQAVGGELRVEGGARGSAVVVEVPRGHADRSHPG